MITFIIRFIYATFCLLPTANILAQQPLFDLTPFRRYENVVSPIYTMIHTSSAIFVSSNRGIYQYDRGTSKSLKKVYIAPKCSRLTIRDTKLYAACGRAVLRFTIGSNSNFPEMWYSNNSTRRYMPFETKELTWYGTSVAAHSHQFGSFFLLSNSTAIPIQELRSSIPAIAATFVSYSQVQYLMSLNGTKIRRFQLGGSLSFYSEVQEPILSFSIDRVSSSSNSSRLFAATLNEVVGWMFANTNQTTVRFNDLSKWDRKQIDFDPAGLIFSSFESGIYVYGFDGVPISVINESNLTLFTYDQGVQQSLFVVNTLNGSSTISEYRPSQPIITTIHPRIAPSRGNTTLIVSLSNTLRKTMDVILQEYYVTVNGRNCTNMRPMNSSSLNCSLPISVGKDSFVKLMLREFEVSEKEFSYLPPKILDISPREGLTAGGESVSLRVLNLGLIGSDMVEIFFGQSKCSSVNQIDPLTIVCNSSPSGSYSGPVPVTVVVGDQQDTSYNFSYKQPILFSILNSLNQPNYAYKPGGGEFIAITGENFVAPATINPDVYIGETRETKFQCRFCKIVSYNRIVCRETAFGVGKNTTVNIYVNNTKWNSTGLISFLSPIVREATPKISTFLGGEILTITGQNFGFYENKPLVSLIPKQDLNKSYACLEPTWVSDSNLTCVIPDNLMEYDEYLIFVQIGNQKSLDSSSIYRLFDALPPTAKSFRLNITEQVNWIISLGGNDSSGSTNFEVRITDFPKFGKLYNYESNESGYGSELDTFLNLVTDPLHRVVYFTDYVSYVPSDSFNYSISNGYRKSEKDGIVELDIQFVNRPPVFKESTSRILYLKQKDASQEGTVSVSFDIVIYDRDEVSHFTLKPDNVTSQKGNWQMTIGSSTSQIDVTKPIRIPISRGNSSLHRITFRIIHDLKGGAYPYAEFAWRLFDSFNIPGESQFSIRVMVNCRIGYYNRIWGDGDICDTCPIGADCSADGRDGITNEAGYFALNSSFYVPCFPVESCPGSYFTGTVPQTCEIGYFGYRCGKCMSRFYRSSSKCFPCTSESMPLGLSIFLITCLLCILFIGSLYLRDYQMGFVGVVISYAQTISILKNMKLKWPSLVLGLLNLMSFFNLDSEIFHPECFFSELENSYEFKVYFSAISPFILVTIASVLFFLIYVRQKLFGARNVADNNAIKFRYISALLFIFKYMQFNILSTSLDLFSCTSGGGRSFFEPQPDRVCYGDWWYKLLPLSLTGMFLYGLGLPLLFLWLVKVRKRVKHAKDPRNSRFDIWVMRATDGWDLELKESYLHWDIVIMARKICVSVIQVLFVGFVQVQATFYIIIFLISLIIHNRYQPYKSLLLNRLEGFTLFCSIQILLLGVLFIVSDTGDLANQYSKTQIAVTTILSILLLTSFVIMIYMGLKLIRESWKNRNFSVPDRHPISITSSYVKSPTIDSSPVRM